MFNKEWKCLLLIIVIFIAACIETDIYLPAFADMMTFFSISEEKVQSLLTWNFIGVCLSGPLYGPISDSIGRKKPLMFALGLFLLGSLMTVIANEFNTMLLGRVLQGLGSGGCFTLGTAIIFDIFKEKKAIEALNKINSIVPFIMAGAPMLGGYLNLVYGFRSNFLLIAVAVMISLAICWLFFEESLKADQRSPLQMRKILKDFSTVSLSVPFWQTTLIVSLLFAGYLAFLSGISVLFVIELGVSKQALPFFQAALLGGWLIANFTCNPAIKRLGIPKIKTIGTALFVFGGIILLFGALWMPLNPYLLTLGMIFYSFGANWTQGLYFPEGMELFPDIKGVTSSFLTSARLLIAAGVVGIASSLYDKTVFPIVTVVCSVVAITLALIIAYEKASKLQESKSPEKQFPD